MSKYIVAVAFTLALPPASRAESTPDLLLVGARVLDRAGERLLDDRAVYIHEGRIAQIAAADAIKLPEKSSPTRVELNGLTLIPGLMDLHSHLLLHPYNETVWDEQVLRESLELR